ncbi:hypothetical protein LIER_28155 [Lithospermum erythrorhizon]|uniref:Cystatin domain-containing protein n=1 Tax=Lithospermum erythrorhizon TaxID=34254 RepID=A0AAV3RG85_LITER
MVNLLIVVWWLTSSIGADYTVNRVVKVCTQVDGGIMYFITFEAINSKDHFQVFQAKVFEPPKGPNEVLLVRLKA